MRRDAPNQLGLWAAADEEGRRRMALLADALSAIDADLHLVTFVRLVFERTQGGAVGCPWRPTLEELGRRPWGLCCGRTKLCGTLREAQRARLVTVTQRHDGAGRTQANGYEIDWDGVAWLLGRTECAPRTPQCAPRTPGSVVRTPGCAPLSSKNKKSFCDLNDMSEEEENISSSSSIQCQEGGAHSVVADEDLPAVAAAANVVLRALFGEMPPRTDDGDELMLGVVILARALGCEEWPRRAAERTARHRPTRNPMGYWRRVLADTLPDYHPASTDETAERDLRVMLRQLRPETRRVRRRLRRRKERYQGSERRGDAR